MSGGIARAVAAGTLPGRVWLYSNFDCNLACGYCLTESCPTSPPRALTPEQMLRVGREAAELGFTGLGVNGGEPLLLPWIPEVVAELADILPTVLLTNGSLLAGRGIERVRVLAGKDVAIQISLDRPDPGPNDAGRAPRSFRTVLAVVPRLVALGLRVRIATTLDEPDAAEVERLRGLVRGLGVAPGDHFVRPMVCRGRAADGGRGVPVTIDNLPPELTVTSEGSFWSPFGCTVRHGRLDTDMLLTRTILPLRVAADAMLEVVAGTPPPGDDALLGIR